MRTHTTHTRDAALRELSRINRGLIAGSVLLTGALTDVAANAFPGSKVKTAVLPAGGHRKAAASHASAGTPRTATQPLQPPAQAPSAGSETTPAQEPVHESAPAPEPAQESAPVVSGGS
jgi:hypothetical protein